MRLPKLLLEGAQPLDSIGGVSKKSMWFNG